MSDEPLSRPEIEALQRQLSLLSEPAVRDAYVQAHARMLPWARRTAKPCRGPAFPKCLEGPLALGAEWKTEKIT